MAPQGSAFENTFHHGTLQGILWWPELDQLWRQVRARAEEGWYLYQVGSAPPQTPASAPEVLAFVGEIDETLRRLQRFDHCGMVYVDDKDHPQFISVYHPQRAGACGSSDAVLPGWLLTLCKPVELANPGDGIPSPSRWWNRWFLNNFDFGF